MMQAFRSMPGGRHLAGLMILGLAVGVVACGGGSGGGGPSGYAGSLPDDSPSTDTRLVTGTVEGGDVVVGSTLLTVPAASLKLTVDDNPSRIAVGADGSFRIEDVEDGHHTLHIEHADGIEAHVPFRMIGGRSFSLGKITVNDGQLEDFTGFNGYHFGFMDVDSDGFNDYFADVDGNGICDPGFEYEGYAYYMPHGFMDRDGDGRNDLFRDANGDGQNDLDGMPYFQGFGFVDENGDGVNDNFMDTDGDGICDVTAMPFRHPFGWMDLDKDLINDLFMDANGDGANDVTGETYVALPGWADLDGDHMNDFFRDANGDGINDFGSMPMGYAHGFGWADADGDGVNDYYVDADGDGVNDLDFGRYGGMYCGYGFMTSGLDSDGDGLDDETGTPVSHGFGWVDSNNDSMNDFFRDANGDGVNDLTGHEYMGGYMMGWQWQEEDTTPGDDGWPMHGHGMWR